MSEEQREEECCTKMDMAEYAKKSFGMFGGKEQEVKLLVENRLAGVIIDRFGKDVMMIPKDADHFTVNVNVHVSSQFLGWIFSLGEGVKILAPDEVVEQMKREIERLVRQYKKAE
ncbi:MAG: WYL domain-containing protein, partial [Blautia sp.]|nr:WYL domain-containing protein [Blautia sp.]